MKTFKEYLLINILLIGFHFMMYFTAVMGFGSATGRPPKIEIIKFLLFFSAIGASPNLLVFLFSAIRRNSIRENALWASVFSLIVMVGYFTVYWNLLNMS
ncbi:hypothetical protein [Paenisporosarcina sp. TG-14]|uniref:hypothetical protein n=1 Tax=Paenisporosarcina sp. TG-14 TaxID=1231057 RepID=UPI0003639D99|nr:hypothetical protein [Paenisporosarcina sp. TG-14]